MTFFEVFTFKAKKEEAFQQFFYKQDLLVCRAAASLVITIMLLLSIIDFYRVQDFTWVVIARLIICAFLILLLVLTFQKKRSATQLQVWLIATNIVFLGSLFFMDSMTQMPPFYLTNSIVVYIFLAVTVSALRYRYSSVIIILLVTLFLFYHTTSYNSAFHKSQIPNVVISLHVGLLIGFVWERYKRINFLQQTQLNNLINIFSHDMVSPMNSLLSLLSLNDRNLLEKAELDIHIENIKKATSNNILLLQNLVKWSKSQMEGFVPKAEPIEMKTLVEDAVSLLQQTAAEKNITFHNHVTKNHTCLADLEMTKLVLRNTLSNAIKFSHPAGAIHIRVQDENDFITLSIEDAGVGMTQEEIDRLFTLKIQSSPGTADERGTGIGLYMTREFVTLNKGEISVASSKGNGTTVKVRLPGKRVM